MAPTVRLVPPSLVVEPGAEVDARVLVRNVGEREGRYRLEVSGPAAGWATIEPAVLVVPPGGERECVLWVRLPRASPGGAGRVPFVVHVKAENTDVELAVAEGVLDVAGAPELAVTVEPPASRGTFAGVHRVVVENLGESPARAVLSARGQRGADVELGDDTVVVESGGKSRVRLTVRPRRRFLRGPPRRHEFEVHVEPLGGAPLRAGGALLQRPLAARALPLSAVALLSVVALAAAAIRVLAPADDEGGVRTDARPPLATTLVPRETTTVVPETTVPAAPPPTTTTMPPVPPEQRRVAFQSDRTGNSEIYAARPDGSGLVNLTNHPAHDSEPAWSPDGHRLAFDSDRGGSGFDIYVMRADGSEVTRLTSEPAPDGYPTWSPDGTRIAFVTLRDGNTEIYVMNADGGGQRRLTTSISDDARPAWSPDGTRLAFHSNREGNHDVYVMNADGTGAVNLTRAPGSDLNPAWSPDGGRLAFDSTRDGGSPELYTMGADGSRPTRLTTNPARDFWPAWSRDGRAIAFQSNRDGDQEVYVARLPRGDVTRITTSAGLDGEPSW